MTGGAVAERTPRWPTLLRLGRVSNLPTVWTNCLAGCVLAGALPGNADLAGLLVSISLFYVAGMFLNDAFDHERDGRERPERPIPSGRVSARSVLVMGLGLLGAGLMVLAIPMIRTGRADLRLAVGGVVLAALIFYYDYNHHANPVAPTVMAACRAMIYVLAGIVAAPVLPARLIAGAVLLFAYVIGLTYAARQESLNRVQNLWPLVLLGVPFLWAAPMLLGADLGAVLYAGFLAWVCLALSLLIGRRKRNVPGAVVRLIAGISLLDAVLIAGVPGHEGLALMAVAGFLLTLSLQRFIPGT